PKGRELLPPLLPLSWKVPTRPGSEFMSEPANLPRVFLPTQSGEEIQFVIGYLALEPDGTAWAYPDEKMHQQNPRGTTAFQLDPLRLQSHPSSGKNGRVYLYGEVLSVSPREFHRLLRVGPLSEPG